MIQHIIFDCDGVLIDSEILSFAVDEKLLPDYGVKITASELARDFGGVTYGEMIAALNTRFSADIDAVSYQERCEAELARTFQTDLQAIAGIPDLLTKLSVPIALASGSDLARLDQCLRLTSLEGFFEDRVFSAEQVARGKPAPHVFLLAASSCGWRPEKCLVIEDSPSGIVAAKAAGMQSVGFLGGAHRSDADADILRDAGAEYVAGNSADLHRYLQDFGLISA
ncbi:MULTISPECIES: HAD family hydrolase [unclassified Thalassospira]|uniref:HAD family hydrolase n=1 Tax=unclassified Thalassospira TaxID=2648997 RepID=UPI0025D5D814|nr:MULTISPECIES: HAD-IA family hydrolase [unclassified Thalassospira]|tara:strand:- start:1155 stop:1829 length:675 start_codon:yes stop_codon:yes gene_type:complete